MIEKKRKMFLIIGLVSLFFVISGCEELQENNISVEDFQINHSMKDLIIKTDKTVYSQNEYVYFVIYNGFNKDLVLGGVTGCGGDVYIISQFNGVEWDDFFLSYGNCEMEIIKNIKSKEKLLSIWDQKIYPNMYTRKKTIAGKGIYKIKVDYIYMNYKGNPALVRVESNEFRII